MMTLPSLSMATRGPYPSSARCIYCREQFAPADLHDEHIIPFALNGRWVLKQATCVPCRALTSDTYENRGLQTVYLLPRLMLEFKRRKKKTKKKLPPMFGQPTAHLANVDHLDALELELSQYPRIMTLPNFRPPGKLINVNRTPGNLEYQQWSYNFSHIVKLPQSPVDSKIQSLRQLFDINATGLMVAKIAYCFAVAELGLRGFRGDEIRQLICNEKDNEVYNFFGGSLNDERLTNRHLHGLAFRERAGFLTVIVHLFSSFGAPPYEVVVAPL
jgi:HNH endonuclease